ncbi:hypothetical protein N7499_012027 [Penicillium canescens]|uniref:Uncharacterized protein n=1 Tax=Penicillium canescens TaxID=5083 RepID=A0AAD6ILC3_PENCN|nr:uncharacterized protein N7446_007297 [Penicillium canescens]KAJ5991370.1 hypothetical protein N7522_011577 [Penicillium canescens]KAJ6049373.1 hypothetical protein N7444_006089 [Penicillium canescens]KAJ6052657.1 hypothetical protein N7460_003191 [Penicillium canescens]KAJ6063177.1 hypothetical protein N7446_007297 [Penicillium canescens]KAJ6070140.1 hypothetical protein N7499_012027 [Penicillium canescens]
MPPTSPNSVPRDFNASNPSVAFSDQWTNPIDVFSVLLILGGDVVGRALAQLAGSSVTPVAFSFGWVAYAVTAVVSTIGENKLMPLPDCACKIINGRTGYVRDNSSWVIGRIMRDYESWMDDRNKDGPIHRRLKRMIDERWKSDQEEAEANEPGAGARVKKPAQVGLCVSVYKAGNANPGYPGRDWVYYLGLATSIVQLGIGAIPCGVYGDWGILLVTGSGIALSFAVGALPQWKREKWACRRNTDKTVILTRGNGSQHAIVIIGNNVGLDFEDLATGPVTADISASLSTRVFLIFLATLWILLLITAAGLRHNAWFLLAVGGLGIIQNIIAAGVRRSPKSFGIPLTPEGVLGETKVMPTLFVVEDAYPRVGRSMLKTFFPGPLRPDEKEKWERYERRANDLDRSGVGGGQ